MSIICHYNRWPERGIGTTPEYSYYDGYDRLQTIPANTLGRVYNYDNMLLDYNYGYTDTEANAVAALMKDMGTSVKMMYYTNKSGESGAFDINVGVALTTYFQYSKSARVTRRDSYPIEEWNALVRENLRNCGPMYYSGGNGVGGHAFVVDGYTANDFFHFNFGWGGDSNGWYQIPNIAFYLNQLTILGLTPDRDNSSTYSDSIYLVSLYDDTGIVYRGMHTEATRYEYGQTYDFHIGGIYNYGTRTYNGNIAIVHCNRDDVWRSVLGEYTINDMGLLPSPKISRRATTYVCSTEVPTAMSGCLSAASMRATSTRYTSQPLPRRLPRALASATTRQEDISCWSHQMPCRQSYTTLPARCRSLRLRHTTPYGISYPRRANIS